MDLELFLRDIFPVSLVKLKVGLFQYFVLHFVILLREKSDLQTDLTALSRVDFQLNDENHLFLE